MRLDLRACSAEDVEEAVRSLERDGYVLLDGLADQLTPRFRAHFARAFGVADAEMGALLNPRSAPVQLSAEVRRRLARIEPDADLKRAVFRVLAPVFKRTLGSFVHVNSTFHGQFKSGPAPAVDHGGYQDSFVEVQGQYLLHQDFTGARLPTSPSALTLWVPLNDCDDWNLRLYPKSHRKGLLCNRWMDLDDPRLSALEAPVDIRARAGQGVLFHALLLHGSSNPGLSRRVSCDVRFFPLCGFLPSEVHVLGERPLAEQELALSQAPGPHVRAGLLEALTYLGALRTESLGAEPILAWIECIEQLLAGDAAAARRAFERFVNHGFGVDDAGAYRRFLEAPLQFEPLRALHARLGQLEPDSALLAGLERRLARAEAVR